MGFAYGIVLYLKEKQSGRTSTLPPYVVQRRLTLPQYHPPLTVLGPPPPVYQSETPSFPPPPPYESIAQPLK
ncbi:hypothetical protein H4R34_002438 [Dimargaris verticillata]|uniref:Uncharacterized protein n=1 Tax=Dimargaris verticillata TaxID=2761393 RepID=A0A9W8B805_9FUNG|nr:hypothetical protein H4R34_002438 [Dimargaris verticillata]